MSQRRGCYVASDQGCFGVTWAEKKSGEGQVDPWLFVVPRTQMTLLLIEQGLVLGGLTFKNRG